MTIPVLNNDFCQQVLDSITAHVAILDEQGVIVFTNRAWQEYAGSNALNGPFDCIGMNYLSICDRAVDTSEDEVAGTVGAGIRAVLTGEKDEFFTHYPCHSENQKSWYAVRVVPFRGDSRKLVIVTHEDITRIMEIQEELENKEKQLEDTNTALRVLVTQQQEQNKKIEENVLLNIQQYTRPYLTELQASRLSDRQKELVSLIETNLNDVTSSFTHNLISLKTMLTPQELSIANHIRNGKSSKEIADLLYLSVSGVDFHRKKLRKKLGLTNTKQDLRAYLLSMQ